MRPTPLKRAGCLVNRTPIKRGRNYAKRTKPAYPGEWIPCALCGKTAEEEHHVYSGTANRRMSEKYGMKVMLCRTCHEDVQAGGARDLLLKMGHQRIFEETHTREEFMQIFGRSWL